MVEYRLAAMIVLSIAIPATLLALRARLGGSIRNAKLLTINFFSVWISIILIVYLEDVYLTQKLNSFDLDDDGFFGGSEITSEQERYMFLATNDLGRNLAPVTGGFVAFLHTIVFFVWLSIYQWCVGRRNTQQR